MSMPIRREHGMLNPNAHGLPHTEAHQPPPIALTEPQSGCFARRKALAALMPPPRVPLSRWLEGYLMLVSQAGSPPCVSFLASCQPRS